MLMKRLYITSDVLHAVTYALLLLNTDLHVADVVNRMSRTDFVSNTMAAIKAQTENSASENGAKTPTMDSNANSYFSEDIYGSGGNRTGSRVSLDKWREGVTGSAAKLRGSKQQSISSASSAATLGSASSGPPVVASPIKESGSGQSSSAKSYAGANDTVRQFSQTSRTGSLAAAQTRAWEAEVESVLKEIYAAIKATPVMQPLEYSQLAPPTSRSSPSSPYQTWNGNVNRTPSRRSQSSLGGAGAHPDRNVQYKRASIRNFLGASHESLRASSPTPSAGSTSFSGAFSGHTSFSSATTAYTHPTMGFASNLSHSIIREQQEEDSRSETSDLSEDDEELALLGAPWAKEGILQKKHYWEAPGRRSKDKNWQQVFAVITKGEMKMFQFGGSGFGGGGSGQGGMGGGNWLVSLLLLPFEIYLRRLS